MEDIKSVRPKEWQESSKFLNWLWTIFGGAIISTTAVLLITVFNYLNTQANNIRGDLETANIQLRETINKNNQRIANVEGQLDAYIKQLAKDEESIKQQQAGLDKLKECVETKEGSKERVDAVTKIIDTLRETDKELKAEIKGLQTPKSEVK